MIGNGPSMLSAWRKLGYASGEFGFNLFWGTTSFFLSYYYTDVLGLPAATAGLVAFVPLLWDGFVDLLMGWLGGRLHTRWGKYRPFVLFGSVPLCLLFALMFLPLGLQGGSLLAFAMASHLLFRTCYGLVSIPFVSLSAAMTHDSTERGSLAAFRIVLATVSTLAVTFFTMPLVKAFGGGDVRFGYFAMSGVYAAVGMAALGTAFLSTSEPIAAAPDHHVAFRAALDMLKRNHQLQLVAAATLIGGTGSTLMVNALHYYYKYNLGVEAAIGPALTVLIGAAAVATPAWAWLATRTSKRFVYIAGGILSLSALLALWILDPATPGGMWPIVIVLGLASAAHALTFWSMLPDTVEYGEWKTGVRSETMIFGVAVFAQKASVGIGLGILGLLLQWIGYHANAVQTPAALNGLHALVTWVPFAFGAASIAIMAFYRLNRDSHAELLRIIASRRSPTPARPVPR